MPDNRPLSEVLAEYPELRGPKGDKGDPGNDGGDGAPGSSAYELAVAAGFQGSPAAWLASLKGDKGDKGDPGNAGTPGTPGRDGTDGEDGASAYQVAVANGFVGNEAAWLLSLKGAKGDTGNTGQAGQDGADGTDGAAGQAGPASIATLIFHADAGVNVTLTNQANAEQGLGNSNRSEAYFDATNFTQVRVVGRVVTVGSANARIYPQYSTNGTAFTTIGTGTGTNALSLATPLGAKKSDWVAIPVGAKADVIWRVAMNGGDGVADPALGYVALQFK